MNEKMRVLVVSDTHRRNENLLKILEKPARIDMIIHAGDGEEEIEFLRRTQAFAVAGVKGNCDWGRSDIPAEMTFELYGRKIFVTHGHRYAVKDGTDLILFKAKKENADIAIFGHTHRPLLEERDGVTILNPGSLSEPRQEDRVPTYAVLEIERTGAFRIKIERV